MKKMCDYIVKGKEVFVGLDVAKRKYATNVRSEKMMVHQTMLPADFEIMRNYLKNNYPQCDITVIYEAGFCGFGLHDYLTAEGIKCIVTPPTSVTIEKVDKKKCDKHDAARLARNLENGDYKECEVPDKERREDRLISRTLEQVEKEIRREKNRIRKFYDFNGLNGKNISEKWYVADWRAARKMSEVEGPVGMSLRVHFSLLDELLRQRRELRRELMKLSRKPRYANAVQLLSSISGVGVMSAIRMVLEWGEDWSRFASASRIAAYSGMVSREFSTGDGQRRGHITGQSRAIIRATLVQCAWTAIRHDPAMMDKYRRVFRNTGSSKKAIVAVARKLVVRMRAIMLSGKPYQVGLLEERLEKKAAKRG